MTRISAVLFVLLGISPFSCLDKIEYDVPDGLSESIVIFGRLVKGNPSRAHVNISQVFDFNAGAQRPIPVNSVRIISETGDHLYLDQNGIGRYEKEIQDGGGFEIAYGKAYAVEVIKAAAVTYVSEFDILVPVPLIDTLYVDQILQDAIDGQGDYYDQEVLSFQISTVALEVGAMPALLWEIERTFKITDLIGQVCYVSENAVTADLRMYNPVDLITDRLDRFEVANSFIDSRLSEGSLYRISQFSLSATTSEFFSNAIETSKKSGGIFESPPGLIASNLRNPENPSELVFGYFYTTELDETSVKLDSLDYPELGTICPPPILQCPGDICCDCLKVQRSTTIIPDLWGC